MAEFNGPNRTEDTVTLILGSEEVILCETYQVKSSILTQPAAFTLRLADNDAAIAILKKYPPNTPFQLRVNDTVFQRGKTDANSVGGTVTAVDISGRDALRELVDTDVIEEESYKNITYAQLVRKQLDLVGLTDAKLAYTNKANRWAITGGKPTETSPPRDVVLEKLETDVGGLTKRETQAHLGESRYAFLRRHLDHVGLFLWADAAGGFVLSEPNGHQAPLFQLVRTYNRASGGSAGSSGYPIGAGGSSNILDDHYSDDTTSRHAEYRVYARGSKKGVRSTALGKVFDPEMQALGFTKTRCVKDASADTPKKAEFMARRMMAEARRSGRRLSYTVEGHTAIALQNGARKVLYAPDTVAWVQDEKYGINGPMYVEGVTFNRDGKQTSTLDLIRIEDLVFSDKSPT